MVFYNGMGLKLIKNIDTQWALSKQRNFLGTKQTTAKLGGEAGTVSPAGAGGTSCSSLWWMIVLNETGVRIMFRNKITVYFYILKQVPLEHCD